MTDKKCDSNCCDFYFDGYDEVEEDYEIQRLKDIIKICEYLIQVRTHKIEKKNIVNNLCNSNKEEDKKEEKEDENVVIHRIHPYYYPSYTKRMPWWHYLWF